VTGNISCLPIRDTVWYPYIIVSPSVVTYDHRLKAFMKYRGLGEGQYSQLIEGKDIKVIEAEI
jgi:hypothetical protein